MTDSSRTELLDRFVNDGSDDAFRGIYNQYLPLVRAVAARNLGSHGHLADDVAQEVFASLARRAGRLRPDTQLAAWLKRVTARTAAGVIRGEGRRQRREALSFREDETSGNSCLLADEAAAVIRECLAALSTEDRRLLELRFVSRFEFREIGSDLGLTPDAARMRVNRALDQLRAMFRRESERSHCAGWSLLAALFPRRSPFPLSFQSIVMTLKMKSAVIGGLIALCLLSATAVHLATKKGEDPSDTTATASTNSAAPSLARSSRANASAEWKLPFHLAARLTPEQERVLAAGNVGDYLRQHPEESDLLVAWATADPKAAEAWLESVGEIEVNDTGYYYSHLGALAAGLFAHGGMEEMQALLKRHESDPLLPPKYQEGGFDTHPWHELSREDTGAEAIRYIQEHPDRTDLAQAFLGGIEDTDRLVAVLDYFRAKGVDCSTDYWDMRSRVEKDGQFLADWAAASNPGALEEILIGWEAANPKEARKWLDSHASRPDLKEVMQQVKPFFDPEPPAAEEDGYDATADDTSADAEDEE